MFLIRTAFWLSLVILFIPIGDSEVTVTGSIDPGPQVSAVQALSAAQDTVADLAGFCGRNPDTCETGSAALKLFGQKAQHGARMLYEYISEVNSGGGTADTLRPEDKDIPWQGPGAQS